MWTSITLWVHPYWELADYSVSATWTEPGDSEGLTMVRQGTIEAGADSSPVEVLQTLVRCLKQPRAGEGTYPPA